MLCFSKKGLKVDDDPPLIPRKQSRNFLKKIRDKVFKKGKKNPQNAPLPNPPLPTNSSPIPSLLNNSQPIPNPPIPGRRSEMTLDITKPYPLYNAMNGISSNAKNTIPSDPKKTIIFSTSCSNFLRVEELEVSEGIQKEKGSESDSQRNVGEVIEVQDCIEKEQANGSIEEVTNLLPLDTTDEELVVPEGIEEQGNNSEYERKTVTHELPLEITTDEPIIFSNFPRIEEVEVPEGMKENDDNNAIEAVPPQVENQESDSESIEEIPQELPLYTTGENGKAIVAYNLQPKDIQSISDEQLYGLDISQPYPLYKIMTITHEQPDINEQRKANKTPISEHTHERVKISPSILLLMSVCFIGFIAAFHLI